MQPRRKGYVLLMVLMLLVIAAFLSAGVARQSIRLTQTAALKESELQRRWGTISAREAVLNRAEIILRLEEQRTQGTVASLETVLPMGEDKITLILTDEQAKLNLNMVYRNEPLPALRRIIGTFSTGDFLIRLRPDPNAKPENIYGSAFSSWGQVYDLASRGEQHHQNDQLPMNIGSELTCWGNGQLNIKRAHPRVFRAVCELVISPTVANELITLLAKNPTWSMDKLLREADLNNTERRQLRRYLTERSRCHSLWTITEGTRRSWCRLDVKTPDGFLENETVSFEY